MNLEVRPFTDPPVLYHRECDSPVHMGKHRVVFCPICKITEDGSQPDKVLCCEECDKPLAVTESDRGRGSYCIGCGYHPSMQDTFFQPFPIAP